MKTFVTIIILPLVIGIILLVSANFTSPTSSSSNDTIHVYNWGEYIDPELLDKFYEETGIRVIYETFDSNEAMMVKVNQGGTKYDLVFPSEYAVEKMIKDDLLMPIDYDQLSNIDNIDPDITNRLEEGLSDFTIPYFYGTVGILYNEEKTEHLDLSTWNTLWDDSLENDILMVDGAREAIGMSLNSMGHSLNETDRDILLEARNKLFELSPNIRGVVGDEISSMMAEDEASLAVVWSGMAKDTMADNENLNYIVPDEGSNLWFDGMAIPKNANNPEGAHLFIDFLLEEENAAINTDWVGYSTPNEAALELLDEETRHDERFYPDDEALDYLEMYRDLGPEMISYYNELFLEFKMTLD